ncbi:hypothetical protein EW145_g4023 [Phellinidium pouzarii]|uniref:Uncharacterized protein n=1 Tax=Phellinidium pouzarii TaxID=167371 RepID=A0A4S4L577_9AGAM|nr:hypothetical protein EW145_g4023 [Phellinidium pouzarii]
MPPVAGPPFDAPAARLRSETATDSTEITDTEKDQAMRQLDGIDGRDLPKKEVAEVSSAAAAAATAKDGDAPDDEDDLDPETARNTVANEKVRRMPSSWHSRSSPSLSPSRSPNKHVGFADEAHHARVLDGHKSLLHTDKMLAGTPDPRASQKTKTHAKELLSFHGELSE